MKLEWSFQRKLVSGVSAVCLLGVVTSSASLFEARTLIANIRHMTQGDSQDLTDAWGLRLLGIRNITDIQACLLTHGSECVPAAQAGSGLLRARIALLQARITDPQGRALLGAVVAADRSYQDAFAHAMSASAAGREVPSDAREVVRRGVSFDEALSALVTRLTSVPPRSLASTRAAVSHSEFLLIAITFATILLLSTLCVILVAVLDRSYGRQSAARDLVERSQIEAKTALTEMATTSRAKDEFLATVSHELRNPLGPILTWTQLLRSGSLDPAASRRAFEIIERSVTTQAQLIDDLIDVSRVVAGKFRLDVRPIDLVSVIRAAVETQITASDAKQIRLQLVLDERAGWVSGDSERLQQVMWNLIANAIKFTPKGGRVQVVLQRAESHVEVVVSDSGIGIDAEFLPHVFETFRQGTAGTTRRHGGLGLGLSIVRHIVESHGGEITAYSDGPGMGSKFTLKLPLLATTGDGGGPVGRHPIARDALANVNLGRLDGLRVLIVEDEPSASEALAVLFHSCGADARVANSVTEALVTLDDWLPDVLVSDIAMPGEDGYSLIRKVRLRSQARGGNTPTVALTAYSKAEDRVIILDAGFQMYVAKPADPNELVAVVGSLARRRGLMDLDADPQGVRPSDAQAVERL